MVVSVFANLLNVFFNYMLIYGKLGAPALGLNGAGIATLLARMIMFALMIWWIRKKCIGFEWKFKWEGIKELLRIGVPSGMQYVFEVGAFATAAIMVGWISAEALAAHNIALNLAAISYMAATGLAAASTIRIGNQMGLKDRRNLRIAGFSSFGLVTVFMGLCSLTFIVFRNALPALYIENDMVQRTASTLLIIAAAFQISDGIQAVGLGVLRGLQDVKIPTIITFVSYWLIAIPSGYVFAFVFGWGVNGVWYALSLGLTIAGIFNMWRFNRLSKKVVF
ncbi:MAG: MATE family efflux transporter, partial [Ekhidna sp.]